MCVCSALLAVRPLRSLIWLAAPAQYYSNGELVFGSSSEPANCSAPAVIRTWRMCDVDALPSFAKTFFDDDEKFLTFPGVTLRGRSSWREKFFERELLKSALLLTSLPIAQTLASNLLAATYWQLLAPRCAILRHVMDHLRLMCSRLALKSLKI